MDDRLKQRKTGVHEQLIRYQQDLIDELDRVRDAIEVFGGSRKAKSSLDVDDKTYNIGEDISGLLLQSKEPVLQSEILNRLKFTFMVAGTLSGG